MINLIVEEIIDEAFWKLTIPDLPPIFIEAGSKGEVKADMRKKLKTSVIKDLEIERVSRPDMIKKYRELSQGKDGKNGEDEGEVDEDMSTASDVDMNPTGRSKRKTDKVRPTMNERQSTRFSTETKLPSNCFSQLFVVLQ